MNVNECLFLTWLYFNPTDKPIIVIFFRLGSVFIHTAIVWLCYLIRSFVVFLSFSFFAKDFVYRVTTCYFVFFVLIVDIVIKIITQWWLLYSILCHCYLCFHHTIYLSCMRLSYKWMVKLHVAIQAGLVHHLLHKQNLHQIWNVTGFFSIRLICLIFGVLAIGWWTFSWVIILLTFKLFEIFMLSSDFCYLSFLEETMWSG